MRNFLESKLFLSLVGYFTGLVNLWLTFWILYKVEHLWPVIPIVVTSIVLFRFSMKLTKPGQNFFDWLKREMNDVW